MLHGGGLVNHPYKSRVREREGPVRRGSVDRERPVSKYSFWVGYYIK